MSIKVSKRLIDLFPFKKINKFSPSVTTLDSAKFLLSKNLKDWHTYDPSKTGVDAWVLITSKDLRNIPEDEARTEILKSTLDLNTLQTLDWNTFKDFWSTENEDPNMLGVAYTFEDVSKFIDIENFEFEYDLKGDHKDDIVSKKLYGSFNNFKVGDLLSSLIFQSNQDVINFGNKTFEDLQAEKNIPFDITADNVWDENTFARHGASIFSDFNDYEGTYDFKNSIINIINFQPSDNYSGLFSLDANFYGTIENLNINVSSCSPWSVLENARNGHGNETKTMHYKNCKIIIDSSSSYDYLFYGNGPTVYFENCYFEIPSDTGLKTYMNKGKVHLINTDVKYLDTENIEHFDDKQLYDSYVEGE